MQLADSSTSLCKRKRSNDQRHDSHTKNRCTNQPTAKAVDSDDLTGVHYEEMLDNLLLHRAETINILEAYFHINDTSHVGSISIHAKVDGASVLRSSDRERDNDTSSCSSEESLEVDDKNVVSFNYAAIEEFLASKSSPGDFWSSIIDMEEEKKLFLAL